MKCQRERWRAVIECILKSAPDQLRTVSPADSIADDHARIQVKDYACLCYGDEFASDMLIADTYIPWAIEWLYYYEIWLVTGEWCGGGIHPTTAKPKSER